MTVVSLAMAQARTVELASLRKGNGVVVKANSTTVESAATRYFELNPKPSFQGILLSTNT
jgi:hypothetical protein